MIRRGFPGPLVDLAAGEPRTSRLSFSASPASLALAYLGWILLCLLLIDKLPRHFVLFGLLEFGGRTGTLCLVAVTLVLSTGLLIYSLTKLLIAAKATITLTAAERDIARGAIDIASDGVLVADIVKEGAAIVYANRAFEEITGYSEGEARGKNCRYLQGSDRLQPEVAEIRQAIEHRQSVSVTLRNYRKNGEMFWNQLRLTPIRNSLNVATHYVGIIRDVTTLREAASELRHVTDLDRLTVVSNRYQFRNRLEKFIKESNGPCVLVLKVNIARFHEINTSFGYETGDALLITVAERLSGLSGFLVGRLGADEFAVATELAAPSEADDVVTHVRDTLAARVVLPGAILEVRFAIGFAVGEQASDDALTLLRRAGVALHESKLTRLRVPSRYDRESDARLRSRAKLTHELQQASMEDGFVFHYQPKVAIETGQIIGAEALIRWVHPVFGVQPPDRFIPIAEETGLILDIGTWGLRKAFSFACQVNQDRPSPLPLSVNVSLVQFLHRDMLRFIETLLQETGADPSWITLELTESVFTESSSDLISAFHRIRELGIGLSIDDFGTGYSSLRYLDTFPLSEIKIDKCFVTNLPESRFKRVIVEAVIKIGRELNVAIVAEGVETAAEASALLDMGCPHGQGHFFSKPLPEQEFLHLLRADRLLGSAVRATLDPGL